MGLFLVIERTKSLREKYSTNFIVMQFICAPQVSNTTYTIQWQSQGLDTKGGGGGAACQVTTVIKINGEYPTSCIAVLELLR